MSTDDVDGKSLAENIANILMEKLKERDEALIAEIKSEIGAGIGAVFEKSNQALESRHQAWLREIKARDQARRQEHQAWLREIKARDQARRQEHQAWLREIKARDQARRQEHQAWLREIEARNEAWRRYTWACDESWYPDIEYRDRATQFAKEKDGIDLWKSRTPWESGVVAATPSIVLASLI